MTEKLYQTVRSFREGASDKMLRLQKDDEKQSIREVIRKRRDSMTVTEVEQKSAAIAAKLLQLEEYIGAKTVLFYAAKGNEVRTKELIEKALQKGKKVLLPITNIAAQELEVSEVNDYNSDLKKGAFGIMEPKRKQEVRANEGKIDIAIVPGVVFDKQGDRLGYGLGYYDKLLRRLRENNRALLCIALAYDFQLVERLPTDHYDQKVDTVITENGIINYFGKGKK